MSEDGIQYMGTKLAVDGSLKGPFLPLGPAISGIALHVEQSGSEAPYTIPLLKADGVVVDVGRRPPSDRAHSDTSGSKAMFRCPVVSRNHAKITFTDSAIPYLSDLGSHHGTHIRRVGEESSRMLTPRTPNRLFDGDVVTFGKTVGKGSNIVNPVVVRVEILFANNTSNASSSPISRTNSMVSSVESPGRIGCGRYGLFEPSSPSSDISISNDGDSDIEEIPSLPKSCHGSSMNNAVAVLRKLLPTSTGGPSALSADGSASPDSDFRTPSPEPVARSSLVLDLLANNNTVEPDPASPMDLASPSSAPESSPPPLVSVLPPYNVEWAPSSSTNCQYAILNSPRSPLFPRTPIPERAEPPALFSPFSRFPDLFSFGIAPAPAAAESRSPSPPPGQRLSASPGPSILPRRRLGSRFGAPLDISVPELGPTLPPIPSIQPLSPLQSQSGSQNSEGTAKEEEIRELKKAFADLKGDHRKIELLRKKYRNRFNAHVTSTSAELERISNELATATEDAKRLSSRIDIAMNDDSRIEDLKVSLNDLSDSLYDKMDGIQDRIDDIQDRSGDDYNELRERLELLETRMAALEERNAHTDSERWDQKAEAELAKDIAAIQNKEEDIMADVEVLKEQMKSLRAETSAKFAANSIASALAQQRDHQAREETIRAIEAARRNALEAMQSEYTESMSSLKRKRSDEDEVESIPGGVAQPSCESSIASTPAPTAEVVVSEVVERPTKRARFAGAVARAANSTVNFTGTVAIGGLITWGLLAYT